MARIRTDFRSLYKALRRSWFYTRNFAKYVLPNSLLRSHFLWQVSRLKGEERSYAESRVNYYVRLPKGAEVNEREAVCVKDFKYPRGKKHKFTTYFFDLFDVVRVAPPLGRFNYIFGDIDWEAEYPSFVKARPIQGGETMSVLTKLNRVRHFAFISDRLSFDEKKPMIVFRNVVRKQPQRTLFLEMYSKHPMCDAGQINNDSYVTDPSFVKPFLTIEEQLNYKFIACIEGHDVATNLKWVMSSNSVAVMPKPKIESWFMEGTLIGGVHYIEVADDYSDLIEKLEYYLAHPEETKRIIENAHRYVDAFRNDKRERLIGRMVTSKYFELTQSLK